MSDALTIRLGEPGDLGEIMELAKISTDENAFLPPSMAKIATKMWSLLHRDHGLVGVVEGPDGKIDGVVLLQIGEVWYSDTIIVEELVVFVHPDRRSAKGGRARRLAKLTKKVADDLMMPLLIGVLSNARTKGKVRMYQREFGEPSGAFFLHNATTGAPGGEWTREESDGNTEPVVIVEGSIGNAG
jgi:hypothetical protein